MSAFKCPHCEGRINWELMSQGFDYLAKHRDGSWNEVKPKGEIKCPHCKKRILYELDTAVTIKVAAHPFDVEVKPTPQFRNLTTKGEIEAQVLADFKEVEGKVIEVKDVVGYDESGSIDICCDPPAKCKVTGGDLHIWVDGNCDPRWNLELAEPHPSLNGMTSLWMYGKSYHLEEPTEEQSAEIKQQLRELIQKYPLEYTEVVEDLKEGR